MNQTMLFRKLVFSQVLLGMVAYCIAERNPSLLLAVGALGALSWPISEGPSGKPLPQWVIVPAAVPVVLYLMVELARQESDIIPAMCHFMMWLQVLLLYSKKNNYDYGQLLVLSLMQMIGASVLSISLIYGLLLAAYSILSIFTLLVFQLKHANDIVVEANKAAAPNPERVTTARPVVGRRYRFHFGLTALVIGGAAAGIGVAVFLVIPRSSDTPNPDIADPFGLRQAGFTSRVQLTGAPPYLGNQQPVLHFAVIPGKLPESQIPSRFLIRGAALDQYDRVSHSWIRGSFLTAGDTNLKLGSTDKPIILEPTLAELPQLTIHFTLRRRSERTLFSVFPVSSIKSNDFSTVSFNVQDQKLSLDDTPSKAVEYEVQTSLRPDPHSLPPILTPVMAETQPDPSLASSPAQVHSPGLPRIKPPTTKGRRPAEYARGWKETNDGVRELALNILHAKGLDRAPNALLDPHDLQIAEALTDYLRTNYKYSLENPNVKSEITDMTKDEPRAQTDATSLEDDPLHNFLFVRKKAHCELFAASLASLARSLGMQARVVTGYLVSEYSYNHFGGYYVVRESNAHAWTEINCPGTGWLTFDATPPGSADVDGESAKRTWLSTLRDLYEHLEFAWVKTVVSYDSASREQVMSNVADAVHTNSDEENWFSKLVGAIRSYFDQWEFDRLNLIIVGFMFVSILVGVATFIRIVLVRHQRLVALQLTALPRAQRIQLAKRLKFYLIMLDMLERHGFVRPSWQSPFAFAKDLAKKHPSRFDSVVHLSEIFYEIRFGYRDLDDERKNRIRTHLKELEFALISRGQGTSPAPAPKPA